jgi:thiol-disulfide isomerase/thioredoxin
LHVTDAKGIRKDITLADFRGKWLLLDFWATWCGPCVSVGLPRLVELENELSSHRDRFAILTVHHTSAKSLEELEPQLEHVSKTFWGGKPLPFPILLDSTGQTLKNYEVHAYPTEFLIDPEGQLVRLHGSAEDFLKERLAGINPKGRLAQELDRSQRFGIDEMPLDLALYYLLGGETRAAVRRVPDGLKAASVDPAEPIPLTLSAQLSVRSWLDLFLSPFDLIAEVRGDEIAIIPRQPGIAPVAPSARQREAAARLEGVLGHPLPFNFRGTTLADVVKTLAERTGEPIALDPVARRAGAIDPEAVLTGSDGGRALGVALEELLEPLGLRPLIRDEVILLARL